MSHRACLLAILLVASGCAYEVDRTDSALVTTDRCELTGFGVLEGGDFISGRVTGDDTGVDGLWLHAAPGGEVVFGTPDRISCRINGRDLADVWGDATVDGASGYTYRIFAEDRSEPGPPELVEGAPEVRTLTASREYRPTRWRDARMDERAIVTIPAELPVTVGNAGNMWAWVTFQRAETFDIVTCRYRGGASTPLPHTPAELAAGERYHLERCTGELYGTDPVVAGSRVDVRWLNLHVHTGAHMLPSRHAAETTVTLDLEMSPLIERPRPLDYYLIEVRDASGAIVFFTDGDVVTGDLRITQFD